MFKQFSSVVYTILQNNFYSVRMHALVVITMTTVWALAACATLTCLIKAWKQRTKIRKIYYFTTHVYLFFTSYRQCLPHKVSFISELPLLCTCHVQLGHLIFNSTTGKKLQSTCIVNTYLCHLHDITFFVNYFSILNVNSVTIPY